MDAARGLAAAHEQQVIHRDFKAQNVVLTVSGVVKVVDFGLARDTQAVEAGVEETLGRPWGTRGHIAPERFQGPGGPRCDQFSWAVALWHALSGEWPFEWSAEGEAWLFAVEGGPRGSVKPVWLRRVLCRALRARPEARFRTMTELIATVALRQRRRRFMKVGSVGASVGLVASAALATMRPAPSLGREGASCSELLAQSVDVRERALQRLGVAEAIDDMSREFLADQVVRSVARWQGDLFGSCSGFVDLRLEPAQAACMRSWLEVLVERVEIVASAPRRDSSMPELLERTVILDGDYCRRSPAVDESVWRASELARALALDGQLELATKHANAALSEALALTKDGTYTATMAEALTARAIVDYRSFDADALDGGLWALSQAQLHATGSGYVAGRLDALAWEAKLLVTYQRPRLERALRAVSEAEALTQRLEIDGQSLTVADLWVARTLVHVAADEFDHAIAASSKAAAIYSQQGRPVAGAKALMNLGASYQLQGDLEHARDHYLEAREILIAAGVPPTHSTLLKTESNLGLLAIWTEDESGLAYLERTSRHAPPAQATKALALAAQWAIERERDEEAVGWAQRCLEASERLEPSDSPRADHWRLICGLTLALAGSNAGEPVVTRALAARRAPFETIYDGWRTWIQHLIDTDRCQDADENLEMLVAYVEAQDALVPQFAAWMEQQRGDIHVCRDRDDGKATAHP